MRNHNKIKPYNCWVGDSQTGEQLYHRSLPTAVKVLSPTSGFSTWESGNGRRNSQRIRLWRIVGCDCRTSTGLWKTETPLLEGTHKVVCASGRRGRISDPWEDWTRPTCYCRRVSCRGGGVAVVHCGGKDTGNRSSGKYSLLWALSESAISPNKEPVGSSAGSPQAKQPTGRERKPTNQQKSGIKFYWALPTRATVSSTHHQSLPSSLLDSLIHQRADSRGKKN